jgi:hypothetical protein
MAAWPPPACAASSESAEHTTQKRFIASLSFVWKSKAAHSPLRSFSLLAALPLRKFNSQKRDIGFSECSTGWQPSLSVIALASDGGGRRYRLRMVRCALAKLMKS